MAEFFPSPGGLALFVNAGDPPLDVLDGLVDMLDEAGVDCLELAVPFPGSVTDGPVVRRSADRALAHGVGLAETLAFVAWVRPRLRRLRIALLADWSHSLKGQPLPEAVARIAGAGVDGLLVHALPPRLGEQYHEAARQARLPVVTTCYHGRSAESLAAAAANASAYVYLVAHYGRSGTAPAAGYAGLAGSIEQLRERTAAPVAVGFGVKTRADVAAIHAAGAHAAIVGSAGVARIERALDRGHDVVAELRDFVAEIHPVTTPRRAS